MNSHQWAAMAGIVCGILIGYGARDMWHMVRNYRGWWHE